ncbi:MAG TPA: hypothetical protein VFT06_12995 [Flavisolibacter sp.]|jgi:hypothetical protein|nr:hypothetical protein [Flavisolibacter sp.]
MYRIGLAILVCLLGACSGNEPRKESTTEKKEEANSRPAFGSHFTATGLPYQLTDTGLLNNKDTASLPADYLAALAQDTSVKKIFGKTTGIKYTPLAKVEEKNRETYYIMKAVAGGKKAAFLVVYDKSGAYGAALPFLVPDDNAATSQASSIDKSFAITKATVQRKENVVLGEGKEVLAYDAKEKRFSLVMTDLLSDNPAVLVNPLDTFPKTNKLAGDYYLNKKNLVAVRDGRHANQILVYIHTENSDGDCKGELKGEFIMTGSSTAVYRQGGDPCILGLAFAGNSVSIKEESGCGNYRGLDCPLSGTFTRKKEEKPKETTKSSKRPKRAQ